MAPDRSRAHCRGFTIVELLVVISIFLLMTALLAPFIRMAKAKSNNNKCANKLRKISLALHSYAADHAGSFPASLGALYPDYLSEEKAFDCPATKRPGTKDDPDYSYRGGLKEDLSARTIIASDLDGNHGRSGVNVVRIDGSVEWTGK